MRSIKWGLGAALAAAALALAGSVSAAEGPIVIGATISETGPFAVDAGYQMRGLELAIDDVNRHGGWLGRKVELKLYDDKSDPGTAVRLYIRLITEDRVNLLIGPYSSGITQAVAPLINKYAMATVEPGASMPDIYTKGNEWNIQGTASSLTYLDQLLPIAQKHGAKSIALLALKSAFACLLSRTARPGQETRHEGGISDHLFAALAGFRRHWARHQECASGRGARLYLLPGLGRDHAGDA
jgi:branched-chain amino acid transport system substrate-binding protein